MGGIGVGAGAGGAAVAVIIIYFFRKRNRLKLAKAARSNLPADKGGSGVSCVKHDNTEPSTVKIDKTEKDVDADRKSDAAASSASAAPVDFECGTDHLTVSDYV